MGQSEISTSVEENKIKRQDSSKCRQVQEDMDAVEWKTAHDPRTGRPYYYHPVTRETSWVKPPSMIKKEKEITFQFFKMMEQNIKKTFTKQKQTSSAPPSSSPSLSQESTPTNHGTTQPLFPNTIQPALKKQTINQQQLNPYTSSNTTDYDTTPPKLFRTLSSKDDLSISKLMYPKKKTNSANISTTTISSSTTTTSSSVAAPTMVSPISEELKRFTHEDQVNVEDDFSTSPTNTSLFDRMSSSSTSSTCTALSSCSYAPTSSKSQVASDSNDNDNRASSSSSNSSNSSSNSHPLVPPLRKRSNSTNSIFVRMGTMNKPDQKITIQCISKVLQDHMRESLQDPITIDPVFYPFITLNNNTRSTYLTLPSLSTITDYICAIYQSAQMESECIIMTLIYVERLLKCTVTRLQLHPCNWKSIAFCSMLMASKVWDDLSMCNADFSKIHIVSYTLREINQLELLYLMAVEYNVRVSAASYAKYYFHLRSIFEQHQLELLTNGNRNSNHIPSHGGGRRHSDMSLVGETTDCTNTSTNVHSANSTRRRRHVHNEMPLNIASAQKMQVISEEYELRMKMLPIPLRRRSKTITTTSTLAAQYKVGEEDDDMNSGLRGSNGTSHGFDQHYQDGGYGIGVGYDIEDGDCLHIRKSNVSLEQLVTMEVKSKVILRD